jgi:hypothetical protein
MTPTAPLRPYRAPTAPQARVTTAPRAPLYRGRGSGTGSGHQFINDRAPLHKAAQTPNVAHDAA